MVDSAPGPVEAIPVRVRVVAVGALLLGAVLLWLTLDAPDGSTRFFASGFALAAVWTAAAAAAPRHGRRRGGVRDRDLLIGVAAGAETGVAAFGAFVAAYAVVERVDWLAEPVTALLDTADGSGRGAVLALALTNALAEELFFRGTLVDAVRGRWRWLAGIGPYAASTAAAGNVALVLAALVMGSAFTALRLRTRSVVPPLACHVVWSTLMIVAFPR